MTNTTTAPTAAELDAMDIDTFLETIATVDITTEADRAAWAAEDARQAAIAAAARRVNEVVAAYYAALDMGDTAGCRQADADAWIARAELAALLA